MTDKERETVVNYISEALWLATLARTDAKNGNDKAFFEHISNAQTLLVDAARQYFMPWRTKEFEESWKNAAAKKKKRYMNRKTKS